jgi:hypothetical protein
MHQYFYGFPSSHFASEKGVIYRECHVTLGLFNEASKSLHIDSVYDAIKLSK